MYIVLDLKDFLLQGFGSGPGFSNLYPDFFLTNTNSQPINEKFSSGPIKSADDRREEYVYIRLCTVIYKTASLAMLKERKDPDFDP
jgi:hypothetical protein